MTTTGKGREGNGFQALGLSDPVYRGIVRMGFRMPTPVQRKSLPVILTGSDTVVMARTGSGKTAAFLIPILEKLVEATDSTHSSTSHKTSGCRAVILSPTRELSLQTLRVLEKLSHFCNHVTSTGIHGGESMEKQFDALARKPDVIVATPGRLAHHLTEIPDFDLKQCVMCILDEADRLLEMGFAAQIRSIGSTLPEHCQKVMLSATMPKVLVEFNKSGFCVEPQVVRLDQEATVSEELRIAFVTCRSSDKDAALLHLLQYLPKQDPQVAYERTAEKNRDGSHTGLTLIFAATRHHVEYITCLLTASHISATMIYGTMDQEARKANLSAFRSGKKSVLVVTDVAARGIDVPLIDHVIHYSFPSNAKLFVHRSGRAARAGRIGYCWALVEPDEMPYMVDLHLFLGRKLSTGSEDNEDYSYTLSEMTPDMVHYGSVPESVLVSEVENVRRIMNSELTGSSQAEALRNLTKVCNNAMKVYRRTRPESSREGVRRAKAILEGERLETGQRVGGSSIVPHPLLRGMEKKRFLERQEKGAVGGLEDLDNLKKREEFLRAMANFRPKETVFEAFSTGGGKDAGVVSHVDKGRTTSKTHDSSASLVAMKHMRRQMKLARNKGISLVVAGSQKESENGEADPEFDGSLDDASPSESALAIESKRVASETVAAVDSGKRRLSKAERKQLKKNPSVSRPQTDRGAASKKSKNLRGSDFRDESFFMHNDLTSNTAEAARSRLIEAAMQPSSSINQKSSTSAAIRMEEAMLDIVGDERADLAQKQRMMRWEKSKRKYVQTSVGSELSGDSKSKKIRLESGQLVKSDKMKLGELYEKWQKKTNRSIGRVGVFDDVTDADGGVVVGGRKGKASAEQGADKTKSASQIRKDRKAKQDMKLKNMKKADRQRLERKDRAVNKQVSSAVKGKGKKGPSGRWAKPRRK